MIVAIHHKLGNAINLAVLVQQYARVGKRDEGRRYQTGHINACFKVLFLGAWGYTFPIYSAVASV